MREHDDVALMDYTFTMAEEVREKTLELLGCCAKYKNFVLSSGCDIPPATPWENIDAFFASYGEYYKRG